MVKRQVLFYFTEIPANILKVRHAFVGEAGSTTCPKGDKANAVTSSPNTAVI